MYYYDVLLLSETWLIHCSKLKLTHHIIFRFDRKVPLVTKPGRRYTYMHLKKVYLLSMKK